MPMIHSISELRVRPEELGARQINYRQDGQVDRKHFAVRTKPPAAADAARACWSRRWAPLLSGVGVEGFLAAVKCGRTRHPESIFEAAFAGLDELYNRKELKWRDSQAECICSAFGGWLRFAAPLRPSLP
jgi:hypothetical protein